MSNSVQPHRRQPTRLPSPWDSPGKNTGVGCHFLLQCMKVKVKSLSHVRLFAIAWTVAHQAPPSMGFSRQEYWSGVSSPVNMQLTSFTCWGFQSLQDSTQDMAQNIICRPCGGTKSPWLYLIIIIWSPLTDFLCSCMFSLLWWNLLFG